MERKGLKLFNKGKFSHIDNEFISEGVLALRELQKVSRKI